MIVSIGLPVEVSGFRKNLLTGIAQIKDVPALGQNGKGDDPVIQPNTIIQALQ
jgi:hypothetical protein